MKFRPYLEPVFQELRIQKIWKHLPVGGVHVDVGCDLPPVLLKRLRGRVKQRIGVDIIAARHKHGTLEILQQDLQKKIDLPTASADSMTLLAVLEHMKHPAEILKEAARILRPGGVLLVTVPSPASRPVLEILSAVGLVRDEMIHQHENYFTPTELISLSKKAGFSSAEVEMFEFGFNTFLKAIR